MNHLFCFGLGFSGKALSLSLLKEGWKVSGTTRDPKKLEVLSQEGFDVYFFPDEECLIEEQLFSATHILVTIPPKVEGDIVFNRYQDILIQARNLQWLGYVSSTGVYGDHKGKWVDETSELMVVDERNKLRLMAENQWRELDRKGKIGVHIFRPAGIYGPGRNVLETVKSGGARRIEKKGQVNGRVHVEDLISVLKASMHKPNPGSIYNVCDDEPASSKEVLEFACSLLKVDPPPLVHFDQVELSDMARKFYLDNKKVRNQKIKMELGVKLRYPNYREGISSIFLGMKSGFLA